MEEPQEKGYQVVVESKAKRTYPKRNRKAYMQQYYLRHKSPATCSGCNKEFACPRTLKYHEENNKTCMIRRLEALFGAMHVEPGVQEEMRRVRKLIGKGEASANKSEG
jgi:hypothetical protein